MSVAIAFRSAFRKGQSIVAGTFLAGNAEHAFNSNYVRWFSTPGQAQRFIDSYMQPGEQAIVVNKEDVLANPGKYF